MRNTYTYTARSSEHSEQVVTFTLYEGRMLVGIGAPLEQIPRVTEAVQAQSTATEGEETSAEATTSDEPRLWLKPVAISLAQRATKPFRIVDVSASVDDGHLAVSAWVRIGGLRLVPISLVSGRIDNLAAATDFVAEVGRRQARRDRPSFLGVFDYWGTWIAATGLVAGLFHLWRHKTYDED